jgi:hypothetical protein
MPQDSLSSKTHGELEDLASKHHTFETFLQEVQRLADTVWHNARAKGHDPQSIVGDSQPASEPQGDDVDGANAEGDGGQPVTTPAEPASPLSEAGMPTSNVGVVVNDAPDEGTSVPVQH